MTPLPAHNATHPKGSGSWGQKGSTNNTFSPEKFERSCSSTTYFCCHNCGEVRRGSRVSESTVVPQADACASSSPSGSGWVWSAAANDTYRDTVDIFLFTLFTSCVVYARKNKKQKTNLIIKQEVTARFIPRFYYEGPFTPVADEELEDAENHAEAAVRARAGGGGRGGQGGGLGGGMGSVPGAATALHHQHPFSASTSPPPQCSNPQPSSSSSPVKKNKKNFLENSATLLAARRWSRAGSAGAGAGAGGGADAGTDAPDDARTSTSMAAEVPKDRGAPKNLLPGKNRNSDG